MRDGDGWYRRPGFWSHRRDAVVATTAEENDRQPPWRTTGPPADHPPDTVADAPGAGLFLDSGPSCSARRRAPLEAIILGTGSTRLGLDSGAVGATAGGMGVSCGPLGTRTRRCRRECDRRRPPARPRDHAGPLPGTTRRGLPGPDGVIDEPPPPPGSEDERDPIAEAEAIGRVRVIVPGTGMPYYMIRPPGSYPYGPGGVFVPGAVPPFVRRILDQVLP